MSAPTTAAVAAAAVAAAATADASLHGSSPLDNMDIALLSEIISFVGSNQYRFVAMVNRRFHKTYFNLYPKYQWTYLNASTVKHAKICWEEINQNDYLFQTALCVSAAKNGCLLALQYLRDVKCRWCSKTCSIAAKNGLLHVLQWCRERECPWDETICSIAARNGRLNIIQ